jgi:hypothetical protein
MRRFVILTAILLAACSPAQPASFFEVTPVSYDLSLETPPEAIQRAMIESALRWKTLQMSGTITMHLPDGSMQVFKEKVWLDPLNSRYRIELIDETKGVYNALRISDGRTIYNVHLNSMLAEQFPYPDFARVGQYVPPVEEGVSYPNPIGGQIGTPLSEMAFSSNFAQNAGTFTPLVMDFVAGREALVVEWTFRENTSPSWKLWLDTQTAVILKMQEFGKESGSALQAERIVESIVFDPAFDSSLFTPPSNLAQPVNPTPAEAKPVVTESNPPAGKEAGELYFFLQPRGGGGSIQLAKVSGACVYDPANCPPLEKVDAPFPFHFTINALAWSPDGRFAAFSYSDHPSGTPTKLWLFDPEGKTWKPLASFPYIDPPFWSPLGDWIAFRTQDGLGGEDVYVIRPDGLELKSVSASLPVEGRPYIMDGWYTGNIIMRSALSGTLYLVRAENGQARPMFDAPIIKSHFVASPDAGFLAFDDYDPNLQTHALKVMEPDGANPVTVVQFTGGSIYPILWSPDGGLIAFNYYGGLAGGEPAAEVYVVRRSGDGLSLVYKGSTVGRLLFSPNGQFLLVEETTSISGGHLFLINLATLEQRILQAPGLSTDFDWYAPSWRP